MKEKKKRSLGAGKRKGCSPNTHTDKVIGRERPSDGEKGKEPGVRVCGGESQRSCVT